MRIGRRIWKGVGSIDVPDTAGNTTITLGVNNVFDKEPPFVAAASENGYDEQTANIKGRMWYVALKKRF